MSTFVIRLLVRMAVVPALFLAMAHAGTTNVVFPDGQADKSLAKGSPERIARSFDGVCWNTGDHGLPSHVIYRKGTGWAVGGSAKVGQALDSLFGQADTNIEVYKFCK